ncbi:MAG: MFS transporter [Planctomycetes bacterium]|nr:MFS transporter [Planctomycetota bacterium]
MAELGVQDSQRSGPFAIPAEPDSEIERSLEASVRDVAAYGQMIGFGEAYFGAYAVWLGVQNWLVGVLGTIPPFVGACVQPFAAHLVDRTGRRRPLYLLGAILQGLMFVPISVSIFLPRDSAYGVLLASVILYFTGVHFSTPAWNSVMGDLVPANRRGRFFGRRASVAVISQCLATFLAGIGLEVFKREGHETHGYLLIFCAALVSRAVSAWYLGQMREPPFKPVTDLKTGRFFKGTFDTNFGRFALFVAAMNFSVAVSGPYFVPYMLHDLKFSYFTFMVSQVVVVIAQILVLQRWGGLGDRVGNRKILVLTAVGVTVIPLFWQFARGPVVVWLTQAFAGITWGGFNLAVGNFLLDALPRERRASGVAQFNFLAGLGVLLGGLFGVMIVDSLPQRYEYLGVPITFFSHLNVIMLVSALLRAATLVLFLRRFDEVREVPNVGVAEILLRTNLVKSIAEAAGDFMTWYRRKP